MNIRPAIWIAVSILGLGCVQPRPAGTGKAGAKGDEGPAADAGRKPSGSIEQLPQTTVSEEDGGAVEPMGPGGSNVLSPPSGGAGGMDATDRAGGAGAGAGGTGGSGKASDQAEPPVAGKAGDNGDKGGGDKDPPMPDAGVPNPAMEPEAAAMLSAIGSWSGRVIDSLGPMFDTCIRIDQLDTPGPAAKVYYVGAEGTRAACNSTLTFVESNGDVYTFTEKIDNGLCFDNGRVVLSLRADGTLRYEWYRVGGQVPSEAGTLEMTASCE